MCKHPPRRLKPIKPPYIATTDLKYRNKLQYFICKDCKQTIAHLKRNLLFLNHYEYKNGKILDYKYHNIFRNYTYLIQFEDNKTWTWLQLTSIN